MTTKTEAQMKVDAASLACAKGQSSMNEAYNALGSRLQVNGYGIYP